ncbi:conserved hypothetical protein [Rhodospirillaceae bacterium LM-1]|nr:conserved hypothetical protein [Rhodospirillaceae bacterium LM-1]
MTIYPASASIFLDFEASSFDGYPVEVGWAVVDHETGVITTEGHIIRPTQGWLDDTENWNPSAQKIHGLSLQDLEEHGESVQAVAKRMETALGGHLEIYSDNVAYDGFWMNQLAVAAGYMNGLDIHLLPVEASLLAPDQKWNSRFYADQKKFLDLAAFEAQKLSAPNHRASADAAFWATSYLIALGLSPVLKKGKGWRQA